MCSGFVRWKFFLGHVNLFELFWVPLVFLGLELLFDRVCWRRVLFLGVVLGFQFLSSLEVFLYLVVVFVPLYLFLRRGEWLGGWRVFLRGFVGVFLVCVVLTSFYWVNFFPLDRGGTRSLEEVREYSLLGMRPNFTFYMIGYFSLFLFGLGLLWGFFGDLEFFWVFFVGFLVSFVLALGPFVGWAPFSLLFRFVPFFSRFRTPYRFLIFSIFFMVGVIGSFASRLSRNKVFAIIFAFMVFLSFYVPSWEFVNVREIRGNDVFGFVSGVSVVSVVDFPVEYDCGYAFYSVLYGSSVVGGCTAFPPGSYERFVDVCGDRFLELGGGCWEVLEEFDVGFVVFHSGRYDGGFDVGWVEELGSVEGVDFVLEDGGKYLFSVDPEQADY